MPNDNMSNFERDVLNRLHTLEMRARSSLRKEMVADLENRHERLVKVVHELTGKLARLTSRHDNLVEHVSERNKDLNRLTERVQDLESTVETLNPVDELDKKMALLDYVNNTIEEKFAGLFQEELNSVKNRLKNVEVQNGVNSGSNLINDRFQSTELTVKNLSFDINGVRDILIHHTARIDEIKDSLTNMDDMVGDRINQMGDDIEGFRNYLADLPVYNEPLIASTMDNMNRNIVVRLQKLEHASHGHHEEQPYDPEVPYKTRLARSLANGNEDLESDLDDILRILPEDNVRVLMGYVKDSVDSLRSSDQFDV